MDKSQKTAPSELPTGGVGPGWLVAVAPVRARDESHHHVGMVGPDASKTVNQKLAGHVVGALSTGATYLAGAGISYVLGAGSLPSVPLLASFHSAWIALGAGIGVIMMLTAASLYVSRQIGTSWLVSRRTTVHIVQFLAHTIISTIGGIVLGVIVGTRGLPDNSPITALLTTKPLLGVSMIALLLLIVIVAPLFTDPPERPSAAGTQTQHRVMRATAISAVTSLLFLGLLSTVLIQPSWCPAAICAVPFDSHGVHDVNFEAVYKVVQSTAYVLPGDPAQYTINNAPHQIPAVLIAPQSSPYRVVLHVDNRQRNGIYPLIIEEVALVIDNTTSPPNPLNVYIAGTNLDYRTEPYLVTYRGQLAGAIIPAAYTLVPGAHVQLEPGGADELDIQIASKVAVDIRFHVRVTYRVANQSDEHMVTLPNQFNVVYGDGANWNPYTVGADGRLVPQL